MQFGEMQLSHIKDRFLHLSFILCKLQNSI